MAPPPKEILCPNSRQVKEGWKELFLHLLLFLKRVYFILNCEFRFPFHSPNAEVKGRCEPLHVGDRLSHDL